MAAQELYTTPLFSDPNLVGYWRLEDVNDSGTNGYNLTNSGVVTFTSGKFNNAGNFNGTNQYLTIADVSCPNLEIPGQKTFVAWCKPSTVSQQGAIAYKGNDGGAEYYGIYIDAAGYFHYVATNAGTKAIVSSIQAEIGQWYLVVGKTDATDTVIFVNGTFDRLGTTANAADTNQPFMVGLFVNQYFGGLIDEVSVFNRALTDGEINSLYNGFLSGGASRKLLGVGA
jgi:hypothetical protein